MKKTTHLLFFLICCLFQAAFAQTSLPYAQEIQTIQAFDKIYPPPKQPIVFVGSSSIRMWSELPWAFKQKAVLNRGLGGAVIYDIQQYLNVLVFPYQPRQLVVYVGENDLMEVGITADTIFARTKDLLSHMREQLPHVPILYLSIKPSPSRAVKINIAREANRKIAAYLATQASVDYIDIFTPMLLQGEPRPELFLKDMLHMNAQGYAIWQKALRKKLIRKK